MFVGLLMGMGSVGLATGSRQAWLLNFSWGMALDVLSSGWNEADIMPTPRVP